MERREIKDSDQRVYSGAIDDEEEELATADVASTCRIEAAWSQRAVVWLLNFEISSIAVMEPF